MVDCVETLNVDVPLLPAETVTVLGFTAKVGPLGEMVGERVTVPAKAPRLMTVIVEVLEAPRAIENEEGLDEIEKSTTLTEIEVEWDSEPLFAATETE